MASLFPFPLSLSLVVMTHPPRSRSSLRGVAINFLEFNVLNCIMPHRPEYVSSSSFEVFGRRDDEHTTVLVIDLHRLAVAVQFRLPT